MAEDKVIANLVIGAGAPHATLIAGALATIYKAGRTFNNVYTSGAGALVGLTFMAPKDKEAPEALQSLINAGVSDSIYDVFPLGYKTFFKRGPFTDLFYRWGQLFEVADNSKRAGRAFNDLVAFWASLLTPTTASVFSDSLCSPCPWVNDVIDFKKLDQCTGTFFANAFNVTKSTTDIFGSRYGGDILPFTADAFEACLAFPFIYSPKTIGSSTYIEGAAMDPLNFGNYQKYVIKNYAETTFPKLTVMMDILGSQKQAIIRTPRNLLDAYGLSLITPIVSLSDAKFNLFRDSQLGKIVTAPNTGDIGDLYEYNEGINHNFLRMQFVIPPEYWPNIIDWRYSNLRNLWDVGVEAGARLLDVYGTRLPRRQDGSANVAS